MEELSLHILDVIENALRAGATEVSVRIVEDPGRDEIRVSVEDNGRGMTSEEKRDAVDPFFTTKQGKRIGLGLPLLSQAARQSGGSLEVDSNPGAGTKLTALFGLSHLDRQPLGDIEGTMAALKIFHRDVLFDYEYVKKIVRGE